MKLGRKGKLSVEVNPDARGVTQSTLTIPEDLTIEFEVTRQSLSSSQEASFRIIGLGEETRDLINKDPYALTEFRAIQFRAGYDSFPLPLVFNGFVRKATSYRRSGQVGAITEINAYDGGLAMVNGWTAQTISAGSTLSNVLRRLADSLPHLSAKSIIGDFANVNTRGKVLFGNTWSIIVEESGNLATIDNGQVKILQPNEALQSLIPVIDSDSGLLGSPRRTPTMLEFDMIFEPRLTIGQVVELRSSFNRLYNGTYKVMGFTHRGTIGPTVSGDCISSVSLFFGPEELKIVRGNPVQ